MNLKDWQAYKCTKEKHDFILYNKEKLTAKWLATAL